MNAAQMVYHFALRIESGEMDRFDVAARCITHADRGIMVDDKFKAKLTNDTEKWLLDLLGTWVVTREEIEGNSVVYTIENKKLGWTHTCCACWIEEHLDPA